MGMDPSARNAQGKTALDVAAINHRRDFLQLIKQADSSCCGDSHESQQEDSSDDDWEDLFS